MITTTSSKTLRDFSELFRVLLYGQKLLSYKHFPKLVSENSSYFHDCLSLPRFQNEHSSAYHR